MNSEWFRVKLIEYKRYMIFIYTQAVARSVCYSPMAPDMVIRMIPPFCILPLDQMREKEQV